MLFRNWSLGLGAIVRVKVAYCAHRTPSFTPVQTLTTLSLLRASGGVSHPSRPQRGKIRRYSSSRVRMKPVRGQRSKKYQRSDWRIPIGWGNSSPPWNSIQPPPRKATLSVFSTENILRQPGFSWLNTTSRFTKTWNINCFLVPDFSSVEKKILLKSRGFLFHYNIYNCDMKL